MWAPRDTSAGTSEASSPRHAARGVADAETDLPGGRMDALPFSEASRGRRREDENETEDWCVGGFDVFERRTSPLRRKRAPLVPSEFDHDALVRRALEQARGGEFSLKKGVDPAHPAAVAPLRALVPGNASLHRRAEEASVRERARRGLSFDTRGDGGGTATPATRRSPSPSEPNAFVKRRREANAAEAPKPSPPRTPASHGNRATASENKCSSKDSNKCDSLFVSCSPASSEASEASSFWSAEKKQKQVLGVSSRAREDAKRSKPRRPRRAGPYSSSRASLRASSPPQASRGDCRRAVALVRARTRWNRCRRGCTPRGDGKNETRSASGAASPARRLRSRRCAPSRRSASGELAKTLSAFTHRQAAEREVSRDVSRDVTVHSTRPVPTETTRWTSSEALATTPPCVFSLLKTHGCVMRRLSSPRPPPPVVAFRRWRRFVKTRTTKRARRTKRASLADARGIDSHEKGARVAEALARNREREDDASRRGDARRRDGEGFFDVTERAAYSPPGDS